MTTHIDEDLNASLRNGVGTLEPKKRGEKTLVQKLVAVMEAVSRVPKRGHNTFHNYHYALEADIAEACRVEMVKQGVMLLPSVITETREALPSRDERKPVQFLTSLEMQMTFTDGVTEVRQPWRGSGVDPSDKGLYKAMTGAEKYFLMKTFLMPTGDDPEKDAGHEAETTAVPHESTTGDTSRPSPVTQVDAQAAISKLGEDPVQIMEVEEYAGTSKGSGNPYVKYTIKTSTGEVLSTFKDELGATAQAARDNQTPVFVTSKPASDPRWNADLTGIVPADAISTGMPVEEPIPF